VEEIAGELEGAIRESQAVEAVTSLAESLEEPLKGLWTKLKGVLPQEEEEETGGAGELTREGVQALDPSLLEGLREALATADLDAFEELLDQAPEAEEYMVKGLRELAESFDYERLGELL
jgi:hypothetical protein